MSTPEDFVANLLLFNGGHRVNPERLADRVAADKSRDRANAEELIRHVGQLASTLKRSRERADLDHWDWRRSPTPERLAAARAAQAAVTEAREALLEACCGDEGLYADVMARHR